MPRARLALLGATAALYLGVGLFDHEVWSPTEPAVAGVVWNMVARGSLATPRINDFPYLEKPPGYYWLAWLACEAGGGADVRLMRLPAVLAGLACLGLVFGSCRRRYGEEVASVTTLLAASNYALWQLSHRADANVLVLLLCFAALALFAGSLPGRGEAPPRSTVARDLALAFVLALSFYAKNFFALLIVIPPIAVFLLWKRRFARLALIGAATLGLTGLLVAPWVAALVREGGLEPVRVVFVDNTLGRFFTVDNLEGLELGPLNDAFRVEKERSPFFYLPYLFGVPLPWSLIFVAASVELFRKRDAGEYRFFLKLALVSIPVVLSTSSSKTGTYLLPALFPVFLTLGDFLGDLLRRPEAVPAWARGFAIANVVLAAAFLLLAPVVLAWFSADPWVLDVLLPIAAGMWWFGFRRRHELLAWRTLHALLCFGLLAGFVLLQVLVPWLDRRKSSAPFLEALAAEVEGRELYTTLADDLQLPLLNYYLDRPVIVLERVEDARPVLESERPATVIVQRNLYVRRRADWDRLPLSIRLSPGRHPEVAVFSNRPSDPTPSAATRRARRHPPRTSPDRVRRPPP